MLDAVYLISSRANISVWPKIVKSLRAVVERIVFGKHLLPGPGNGGFLGPDTIAHYCSRWVAIRKGRPVQQHHALEAGALKALDRDALRG